MNPETTVETCIYRSRRRNRPCKKTAEIGPLCARHDAAVTRRIRKQRTVSVDCMLYGGLFLIGYAATVAYDLVTKGT